MEKSNKMMTIQYKPSTIQYLDYLLKQLELADQVFFQVNESTKQTLKQYASLKNKTLKTKKKDGTKEKSNKEEADNKANNNENMHSVTRDKLDKILKLAKSIRYQEQNKGNSNEKHESCAKKESKEALEERDKRIDEVPIAEKINNQFLQLFQLKKKMVETRTNMQTQFESFQSSLLPNDRTNSIDAKEQTMSQRFKLANLLAISDYMKTLQAHLNNIIDEENNKWKENDSCSSLFFEIYNSFDSTVTQTLSDLDSDALVMEYKKKIMDAMRCKQKKASSKDKYFPNVYMSKWLPSYIVPKEINLDFAPENLSSDSSHLYPTATYSDVSELVELNCVRNKIQHLLLRKHVESILSQCMVDPQQ
jgi:hypothetical protein